MTRSSNPVRKSFPAASRLAFFPALLLAMCCGTPGCDSKPEAPPRVDPPAAATQAAATRPTTRDLLEGPRRRQSLGSDRLPLTIEVPKSWHLANDSIGVGSSTWLEGDTPHGEVRLQIVAQGAAMKEGVVAALEKSARAQASTQPENLMIVPLRDIGAMARKMERREFLHGVPFAKDDGTAGRGDRVDWTVEVFVKQVDGCNIVLLTFAQMSMQQYDADKDFLEHVVDTLHYDAAGGALD